MYAITESRRATVSCKNLFSSSNNDRLIPTSTSRRHVYNNLNTKRNNNANNNNNTLPRTSNYSAKSQQKFNYVKNENSSKSNVFHVIFSTEQTNNHETKFVSRTHNKLLRTPLNPLSPAFYSTQQISLMSEQQRDTLPSYSKVPVVSETSDYSSGTDLEHQSMKHISPQTDSSIFTFDLDEPSVSYSIDNMNNQTPSPSIRRTSLLSSSSSSVATSPSSSISNLSSLSSSPSELQTNFNTLNRLWDRRSLSIYNNNNNNNSNNNNVYNDLMTMCYCEKDNFSNRKRSRLNSYPMRRNTMINYCENCQMKRMKTNSRSKNNSNRQQKQRYNNRIYNSLMEPIKFSTNLTGRNISFTVEYHDSIKCTCPLPLLPYTNVYRNSCKCYLSNDSSAYMMMNSLNQYQDDLYYLDANNNPLMQQANPAYSYHDFYLTKNISSIYFDDSSITDVIDNVPPYFLRYTSSSIEKEPIEPPPKRSWLRLESPNNNQPTAIFTVMNYNILCDKYATRHVYGYCPSWALKWDYRRKQILDELLSYAADIIALQEIETDQYHLYFLPELKKVGYDGVFSPKSRAKTMGEQERRFVDGCAIFYRQSKFRLIKDYLVEFNQLAMSAANSAACHDMMNRVMTKDNIGLVALLETKEEIYSHAYSNGTVPSDHKQMVFVCTAHIHWDPEYSDVKVIQTLMLLSELKTIIEDATQKYQTKPQTSTDCAAVPLVLCGDFNSLPESGVIEFMRSGKISMNHADFKDLSYESYLQKISQCDLNSKQSTDIKHHFQLQSAYETTTSSHIMPYTNYTYGFKGIIDYVFFSSALMRVLGVLGPIDPEWLSSNKIFGCPQPNVPSDHFSLLVEFELNPLISATNSANNNDEDSNVSTVPIHI